ncbi:MAG: ribonuclease D [Gemmatimonadota bacterium]|nr:ribonuclease D [Gemmatimonadota bacterium]
MTAPADPHTPLYLDDPESTARFLGSIGSTRALALDTEGASYHRFVDRIYLIQLSTKERTAMIDPLAVGVPAGLGALLEDPEVEVVFHDADYDLRLLHQDYGWHPRNIFDTRIAAQLLGFRAVGLAALLERYFDVRLDKKHQRADWSMRPLTADMLNYAAQDTMYLLELRDRLRDELDRVARWAWAAEEFEHLEGTRWDAAESGDGYLRIKGARDLSRRELGLFRELVAWRDGVAAEMDRATFRVAGNEALMDVARQAPPTTDELVRVKGMPRAMVERRGGDILAAIRRGLETPENQLPKFPRPQRWDRDPVFETRSAALKIVRDAAAHRLELDPGVLCSRDRLDAVARRNPATREQLAEVKELRRWQIDVLGDELLTALAKVDSPYK